MREAMGERVEAGRAWRCLVAAVAAAIVLGGCGGSGSDVPTQPSTRVLPDDPREWICEDSTGPATQAEIDAWCAAHPDRGQPLPADLRDPPPPADFVAYQAYNVRLETFLVDRRITRGSAGSPTNTGASAARRSCRRTAATGNNYGPHFPLRVYYSPEVVDWLCNGRQGEIPDGAMMVKAMSLSVRRL